MTMRPVTLTIVLLLAGCGTSDSVGAPQADTSARTWKYFVAHPAEIAPMQEICRKWSASNAPAVTEPAVVAANCRAAAFAKSQLQLAK